ncbi:MAG: beta-N-acetylhexosaminidase [Odoribacter sp.]|nr:beta-N-acetylhexosaminidase [Odoribacter sp.]
MNRYRLLWVLLAGVMVACCVSAPYEVKLQLLPQPRQVAFDAGDFKLNSRTTLELNVGTGECGELLNSVISGIAGYELLPAENGGGGIRLAVDTAFRPGVPEAYRLRITPEHISLEANATVGLFYGVQTLGQLLSDRQFYREGKKKWVLPVMTIEDEPAFSYRGLHLDVSRHFFPKDFVMKCLDLMSNYKLNRLHWHLTDAAGWRIEIKKYPELTERGAWRSQANYMDWWKGDRRYVTRDSAGAYGGFYTQDDIREVVAYAAKRHITVIPEIEMPGHSEEVVSVYPQLGCYGKPYRNGELCIGNEKTFEFVENVLTEVMELFPSEYIHIGGDEASTSAWKKCSKCQKRMKDNRLKDEKELQSYMIHRVEKFLNAQGRKLIGWDEILDGGLAPEATVMSWRGESGGIKAARMGHDVIMTPGGYCYFDSYQADPRTQPAAIGGFLPYLKVYSYHPVPEELTAEEGKHILGAQANVWAEYIPTTSHAEYMIFPRLLSLAEVVWSPREKKDAEDFKRRVACHIGWLKAKGVNVFTLSDHIDMQTEVDTVRRQVKIGFDSEKYLPEIHYRVNDGREQIYREPFYVRDSARIKAFIVTDGKASDEVLETRVDYHRAVGKPVVYQHRYSGSYPAAGEKTLTDGYRGGLTYGDGRWQGFLADVDVVIDLDSVCDLSYVSADFMQLIGPGVYMPRYVQVSVSEDGQHYREVARIENEVPAEEASLVIRDFTARFQARGRYVRFFAKRQNGFQFIDEVVVY